MECIRTNKERQILMVGLCSAGKTQILHILQQHDEQFFGKPTVGFNMETVEYKDNNLMIWDVGGSDKIRLIWKYFIPVTHGLIFVVDSTDRARVTEAGVELHRLLREEPRKRNQPLLVFANRQDGPDPMTAAEIADKLGLHSLHSRLWHIQSSCARSGDGLYDGLDWLLYNISQRRQIRWRWGFCNSFFVSCYKSH